MPLRRAFVKLGTYFQLLVIILCVCTGAAQTAPEVSLRATWFQAGSQWVLRIQPEDSAYLEARKATINRSSPALRDKRYISLIDPSSGQQIDFELVSPARRETLQSFDVVPRVRLPRPLTVTIRGLIVEDGRGRRLAYQPTTAAISPARDPAFHGSRRDGDDSGPIGGSGPSPTLPTFAGPSRSPNDDPQPSNAPPIEQPDRAPPGIPRFPWPPPIASAFQRVARNLLVEEDASPVLLRNVERSLSDAFSQAGYGERNYYAVPGGFAMASSLEQINVDGSPSRNRWAVEVDAVRDFSLRGYLRALFNARPGHYRVIVFIVTDQPLAQSNARVSSREARAWVRSGVMTLPREIAQREFTADHVCTALIYEFKCLPEGEPQFVEPTRIPGRDHLSKSGLWTALQQAR